MSEVSWDDENYEPPAVPAQKPTDKWAGEDEEEELMDNWDDDDEEKKDDKEKPASEGIFVKKKKKKLADIIAEKEAKQLEMAERKKRDAEEAKNAQTAEEKLAEKMRIQKIQEDADLQLANDLMGTESSVNEEETKLLDEIDLSTTEGLASFRRALIAKVQSTERLEKRPYFVDFVEDLSRDLCQNLEQEEVKRVSAVLNSLYNEKVKANKPKSKKKGGGKAKLNVGQGAITDDISNDFGGFNEYDDFI